MRKQRAFVEYNERTDVIWSVQLLANLVQPVQRHPILWKWIILGSHSALQGAMVCNLSGTDHTGALKPQSRKKMWEFMERNSEDEPVPDEWLADFGTLLTWIQDKKRLVSGVTWHPTDRQLKDLALLHDFRNDFSHYVPKAWSIEASGLPTIIITALEGTEHLMMNAQCVQIHLTGNQKRALVHSLEKARDGLKSLQAKAPRRRAA
jgi:hypothetical protein